jgi:hypothetical protein
MRMIRSTRASNGVACGSDDLTPSAEQKIETHTTIIGIMMSTGGRIKPVGGMGGGAFSRFHPEKARRGLKRSLADHAFGIAGRLICLTRLLEIMHLCTRHLACAVKGHAFLNGKCGSLDGTA